MLTSWAVSRTTWTLFKTAMFEKLSELGLLIGCERSVEGGVGSGKGLNLLTTKTT